MKLGLAPQAPDSDTTNLILYSDACGRHIYLVRLWRHIVSSREYYNKKIDQSLDIRSCLTIEISDMLNNLERKRHTSMSLKNRSKWLFKLGKRAHFVCAEWRKRILLNLTARKVAWLKIHLISVSQNKPLQFQYMYSNNTLECWKTVDLKQKSKGRPVDMGKIINTEKVSDLYYTFYRQLNRGTTDSFLFYQPFISIQTTIQPDSLAFFRFTDSKNDTKTKMNKK